MSLYNLLHGVNDLAPILLGMLGIDKINAPEWPKNSEGKDWYPYDDGLTPEGEQYIAECIKRSHWPLGRFRDIYLTKDESKIVVYTRNGGGNRDNYFYIFDILKHHPNYLRNYDDDFDCTYAYIEFAVPDEYKEMVKGLGQETETIQQKLDKVIKEMEGMTKEEAVKDPRFKPMIELLDKITSPQEKEEEG